MRTKIIEFIGMPRSGKTTQINLLKNYLQKKNLKVHIITDRKRGSVMAVPPEKGIGYNLVFFAKAIDEYYKHQDKDYIIIDRGFYDSLFWFEIENTINRLPRKRVEQLKKTFIEYMKLTDQVICLKIDIKTAFKRHKKKNHQKVDDIVMTERYLKALEKAYSRMKIKDCICIDANQDKQTIHKKITNSLR